MIILEFCTIEKVGSGYDIIFGDGSIVHCATLFEAFFRVCLIENGFFTSKTKFKVIMASVKRVEQ